MFRRGGIIRNSVWETQRWPDIQMEVSSRLGDLFSHISVFFFFCGGVSYLLVLKEPHEDHTTVSMGKQEPCLPVLSLQPKMFSIFYP